jgi:hypothetical protein
MGSFGFGGPSEGLKSKAFVDPYISEIWIKLDGLIISFCGFVILV